MTTQYTTILKLALPVQGELSGTWGDVVNDNITEMVEQAIAGKATINSWTGNSHTLTTADGTTSESRCAILELTDSGTALTGAGTVVCPTNTKLYIVDNNTAEIVTVKTSGGTGVAVPVGKTMLVYCDGTNVVEGVTHANSLSLGTSTSTVNAIDTATDLGAGSSSNSNLPTQLAVKTYVDGQIAATNELSEVLAAGNVTGANDIDVDSAQKVQFRDADIYLNSSVDGQLDIVADGEVQIDTALVDINGNLDVSGTTNISGSVSFTKNAIAGVAISTTSRASNTVTVTNSAVHGLTNGDLVNINGVANRSFNGYFTVSVSSTTVFTYSQTGADESSTGGTSTEIVYNLNASGTALNQMNGPLNIAANSGIDGLEITQSGSGEALSITGGNALFGDNDKAIFGIGNDLQIYHDGSDSYIVDNGTGDLLIRAENNLFLKRTNSDETYFSGAVNGAVTLFHNNNAKLATTLSGVDITGTVTADAYNIGALGSLGSVATDRLFIATADGLGIQFDKDNNRIVPIGADGSTYNNNVSLGSSGLEFKNLALSGTATMDGLRVDGTPVRFVSTAPMLNFMESGVTDSNHRLRQNAGNFVIQKLSDDEGTATDRLFIDGGTGDISFYNAAGNSQALFWDASAESLGIGTTSPAQPIEILKTSAGAVVPMIQLRNGSATAGSGTSIKFMHSTVSNATSGTCELESIRYSGNLGALTFKTSNNGGTVTERMRVDDTGVGIGTSSPATKLHVNGGRSTFYSQDNYAVGVGNIAGQLGGYVGSPSVNVMSFSEPGGVERMRIDASGNLLVDKTAAGFANTGHELRGGGSYAAFTRDGGTPVLVNRKSSDGTLVEYMKDGTTVGSIGTNTGGLYIADAGVGFRFDSGGTDDIIPCNATGAASDGTINLGSSGARFKDLHLSGGVSTNTTTGLSITADATNRGILNLSTSQSYQLLGGSHYGYTGYKTGGYHRWFGSDGGEDMRLDASGNLLVGKTANNITDTGAVIRSTGETFVTRSGAEPLSLNRLSTDGDVLTIRKDSTIVGSIGTVAGDLTIGDDDIGIRFDTGTGLVPWDLGANGTGGLARDAAIDIGASSARFKDLHLSGIAYALAYRAEGTIPNGNTGLVTATSSTASDLALAGMAISKYDNNQSASQVFFRFITNQGGAATGQIVANGSSQAAFGVWSDSRLKENITDLPNQLANITALRPVEFDYIESEGGGHQFGFIAQEVEEIYPDLVGEREDGMKTLAGMGKMEARLIKAIQEQQATIEALTARIAALES